MKHKTTVVHNHSKRACELPSTIKDKMREVEHLQNVLRANSYPDSLVPKRRMILAGPHNRLELKKTTKKFLCSAFCTGCIAQDQQSIESGRSEGKFKIFTLKRALLRVKHKLPRKDRAGVVYAVPCGCGAEYVGETGGT